MRLRMTISFMWMLNSEVVITRGGSEVTDWTVFVLCTVEVEVVQQAQGVEGRHVQKTPFFMDPHARLTKGDLLVPRTLVCL